MGIITSTAAAEARRVLIVDDHPVVREGLRMVIGLDPRLAVCGEAGSLAEGIRQFRQLRPDLVLVDITLQNGSGLELTKSLVARDRGGDGAGHVGARRKAVRRARAAGGARGFVSKSAPTGEVVQAINRVLEGGLYFSEQMTERLLRRLGGNSTEEIISSVDSLSDRKLEDFEHIGHGLTTRQIAERPHLSRKTIETYRDHIKAKLGIANATELTQRAVQWGMEQDGGKNESGAAESH